MLTDPDEAKRLTQVERRKFLVHVLAPFAIAGLLAVVWTGGNILFDLHSHLGIIWSESLRTLLLTFVVCLILVIGLSVVTNENEP